MGPWLAANRFVVERRRFGLDAIGYDVVDAASGARLFECRDEIGGILARLLRLAGSTIAPFRIGVRATDGSLMASFRRGIAPLLSEIDVTDGSGARIGRVRQRLWSIAGSFDLVDARDERLGIVHASWPSAEFRLDDAGAERGRFEPRPGGYAVSLDNALPAASPLRALLLPAVIGLDRVLRG